MVHRGLATISGAMMFCFLMLAGVDTPFFFLHFYESMIYLAIVLMLFYLEDRWAYMLGMLAPVIWVVLMLLNGQLWGALRQPVNYFSQGLQPTGVGMVTLLTAVVAVMMFVGCLRHWRREFAGLGKGWSTFLVSLVIMLVYYGILIVWFAQLTPWD
jgi:hypothetical protein